MGKFTTQLSSSIKGSIAPEIAASQEAGIVTAPVGTSENPSSDILTIANLITFARLALVIIFFPLYIKGDPELRVLSIWLYGIAAVSDFVDGQVARRTQTVSWLGKVMDPIMDVILLITSISALLITGAIPVWIAVFIVLREAILAGGIAWLRMYQTRPMDVLFIGKIATTLLMAGFGFTLIGAPLVPALGLVDVPWLPGLNNVPAPAGLFSVYLGIVFSTITAVIYYKKGLRIRKEVRMARAAQMGK